MTRMGLVINLDTCMDMRGCVTACKMYKDTPMGVYETETFTSYDGSYPDANEYFIPISCQQCSRPTCVSACPDGALAKLDNGIVVVTNQDACTVCTEPLCEKACPYDAIHFDAPTKKVYKCDLCIDLIEEGKRPHCVAGCLSMSRYAGDFDDPKSVVAKTLVEWGSFVHQLKPETGNEPNVYYLLSKHQWKDMEHLFTPHWHEPA